MKPIQFEGQFMVYITESTERSMVARRRLVMVLRQSPAYEQSVAAASSTRCTPPAPATRTPDYEPALSLRVNEQAQEGAIASISPQGFQKHQAYNPQIDTEECL